MIGLILGVISLLLPWFMYSLPILGLLASVFGVVGIILSLTEMKKVKASGQKNNLPLIGLIVSIVATVISIPHLFCFITVCRVGCSAGAGMGWLFQATGL